MKEFELRARMFNLQYPPGVGSLNQYLQMAREEAAERDVERVLEMANKELAELEKDQNE